MNFYAYRNAMENMIAAKNAPKDELLRSTMFFIRPSMTDSRGT